MNYLLAVQVVAIYMLMMHHNILMHHLSLMAIEEEYTDAMIQATIVLSLLESEEDSESGSDDEEPVKKKPRFWMSTQCTEPSWYDRVLLTSADDDPVWMANFRLSKDGIDSLCQVLSDDLSPSETSVRKPISLHKRICIALYKLGSCSEYRSVAKVFGVSVTSVHRYLYMFCDALSKRKGQYIKWYTDEEAAAMADEIRNKYSYPQCVGAIEGTHIPITPPLDGKADYLCRKGYPSIVVQAVADGHYMFRDIYANTPGSAHDASVYRRSPLHDFLQRRMPKRDIVLNGTVVPLHLLGDPAYPLSKLILKGYTGRNLSPEQESFNVYLSSARMCVEITFGKLKSRFRILSKTVDADHRIVPIIITACCVLHNICESNKILMPPPHHDVEAENNQRAFPQPEQYINNELEGRGAEQIRIAVKDNLAANFPLRRAFNV